MVNLFGDDEFWPKASELGVWARVTHEAEVEDKAGAAGPRKTQ